MKILGIYRLDSSRFKTGQYYYQFQGLTDKLLADIKQMPEFVKAEEVLEKRKAQVNIFLVLQKMEIILDFDQNSFQK
jgi:signal peptidase I